MDSLDIANDTAQQFNDQSVKAIRERASTRMQYSGYCRYCTTKVPEPQIFCDSDCRDDWEHRQRMGALNGKQTR